MDNIILGLLLLQSRTIYQLRERINKGLNIMYSSSMGSIQAAIKKLLRNEFIDYEEIVENGKYKKVYSITDNGKKYFIEWVNTPIKTEPIKIPELGKLYFMGFSDKSKRIESIENHILDLNKQYQSMVFIYEEGRKFKAPEAAKDLIKYQLLSAKYGRDILKFNLDWYSQVLVNMKEGTI